MIGRVVGNYRIVEKVGEGGMGAVYRAVDVMLDREVAIKAIRPDLAREPQIVERFRSEAKILARVSHPAIATIYSFFYENEELFLAMEFVRGRSLSKVLETEGAIPWPRAVPLFRSALDGIATAHREGIVHRDLKPDNLMLAEGGRLKVMDFGIARMAGSSHLTRTGLLVGTLRYMAPEQIKGEEVDRRTDVYALGVVLYQMLTGRVPFEGASDFAILKAQIEDQPVPPGTHVRDLPGWLERAVLRALEKDPAQRFQNVEALDDALTRGEATRLGAPVPAGPVDDDEPTLHLPRRPTPVPAPPPPPLTGQPTVASTLPTPPPQGSYRPVELRRPGWGKAILGIAAALAVLVVSAVLFLHSRGETPEEAAPPPQEIQETITAQTSTVAAQPSPAEPDVVKPEPAAQTPPRPAPVVPPRERPVPSPPQEDTPGATFQPVESAPPAEPEPAPAPQEEPSPAESDEPAADESAEELNGPAGDLASASAKLYALHETWLGQKEDEGGEITDADEHLQEELEALEEAASRFHSQFKDGVFARTRNRLRGADAQKRRAEIARRARELVTAGQRVDALMTETQPGPEVRQAWADVKRRCQRIAAMARR
jgi:serine/threonine protein kinase